MKIPNIPNIFSISNLPYISLTSFNIFVAGFPFQTARHEFQNIPIWAEDQCETFNFQQFYVFYPHVFYPHSKIHVQLTVNHVNYSDASFVHEAVTAWVESVNTTQFTACVTRAGRNDYPADSFASVDWIAYQGAPTGGISGEELFPTWWTGAICQTVTIPSVSILSTFFTLVAFSTPLI